MKLKDILIDTAAACSSRWPQAEIAQQKRAQVEELIEQLDALKPALKQNRHKKQECSGRFSKAKSDNLDIAPLQREMQRISAEVNRLDTQRKQIEAMLLALFSDQSESPQLPDQFSDYQLDVAMPITVETVDDGASAAWDMYVNSHPCASLYHGYYWRDIITRSFDHVTTYLMARSADGKICGVMPLVHLRSRLFGKFAISMPFFNYGGPLADNDQTARALLDAAANHARISGLEHLEIRCTRSISDWPCRTDKVSMLRRLPANIEALEQELGAKVRAQIKRGQQENPHVDIGGVELLDAFYRVFSINMRDLGTPVYSKQFFCNILTTASENAHLVVVRLRGKAIAAAFLLGHRGLMEIPWASTLRSANSLNMNMVLYRAVLGFCIERGFRYFDFGRSSQGSGTYHFKKQWGAEPLQHYWYYWLTEGGPLPELKPDSPKFRLLIACWKCLPVALSRLIGPRIVKYLP